MDITILVLERKILDRLEDIKLKISILINKVLIIMTIIKIKIP